MSETRTKRKTAGARPRRCRRLTPAELGDLLERMLATRDKKLAATLREKFIQGFYGRARPTKRK